MPKLEKTNNKRDNITKILALSALFTALIAVGGLAKIPIGAVPITLQMLFVLLSGSIGGRKIGLISVSVYLLMGLIGIPVFSFGGGIFYPLKPTFGYLLGFVPTVIIASVECKTKTTKLLFSFLAVLVTHLIGVIYFFLMSKYYLMAEISLLETVISGSLVFLPSDILFAVIATIVSERLKKHIRTN